jgi:hypothetical protein
LAARWQGRARDPSCRRRLASSFLVVGGDGGLHVFAVTCHHTSSCGRILQARIYLYSERTGVRVEGIIKRYAPRRWRRNWSTPPDAARPVCCRSARLPVANAARSASRFRASSAISFRTLTGPPQVCAHGVLDSGIAPNENRRKSCPVKADGINGRHRQSELTMDDVVTAGLASAERFTPGSVATDVTAISAARLASRPRSSATISFRTVTVSPQVRVHGNLDSPIARNENTRKSCAVKADGINGRHRPVKIAGDNERPPRGERRTLRLPGNGSASSTTGVTHDPRNAANYRVFFLFLVDTGALHGQHDAHSHMPLTASRPSCRRREAAIRVGGVGSHRRRMAGGPKKAAPRGVTDRTPRCV